MAQFHSMCHSQLQWTLVQWISLLQVDHQVDPQVVWVVNLEEWVDHQHIIQANLQLIIQDNNQCSHLPIILARCQCNLHPLWTISNLKIFRLTESLE